MYTSKLFVSVKDENVDQVKYCIAKGADVNATDSYGFTALWHASVLPSNKCMIALLDAKADINKCSPQKWAPIHRGAIQDNVECLKTLVQRGANVNLLSNTGHSPLHWAAWRSSLVTVQLLVNAGATVDRPDDSGDTPLAMSISTCNIGVDVPINVAEFLLNSGAKVANVRQGIERPDWLHRAVAKRRRVMFATLTLKGILKKMHIPKDMINVMGFYVWNTRADEEWQM